MENHYKEVLYWKYCNNCKFRDTKEEQEPCYECLATPGNLDSHKPVKFEEKEDK